ncbi:alpha/beta fold hydrolase [Streptomyces sp. NPDC051567]
MPNGRTATIDGAAHYPTLEGPDAFAEILEDFLREAYAGTD